MTMYCKMMPGCSTGLSLTLGFGSGCWQGAGPSSVLLPREQHLDHPPVPPLGSLGLAQEEEGEGPDLPVAELGADPVVEGVGPVEGAAPVVEGVGPAEGGGPVVEEAVPVVEEVGPAVEGAVPAVEGAVPAVEGVGHVVEGAGPAVEEVGPVEGADHFLQFFSCKKKVITPPPICFPPPPHFGTMPMMFPSASYW